jgi:hypothetical protein
MTCPKRDHRRLDLRAASLLDDNGLTFILDSAKQLAVVHKLTISLSLALQFFPGCVNINSGLRRIVALAPAAALRAMPKSTSLRKSVEITKRTQSILTTIVTIGRVPS